MNSPKIAIVGATGAVGRVFLQLIEERAFPTSAIRLCASESSWGKKLSVNDTALVVEEVTTKVLRDVDIVFIAAGSEVSRRIAPIAIDHKALVIDKSSAFRMDEKVPLVVPEVNGDDLENHNGLIASPNCSTIPLVMVLKPLNNVIPIKRVVVDTYQSVSGAGSGAMVELREQTENVLTGKPTTSQIHPHQMAFNVLPHIEEFHSNGYTNEEMKMIHETRKILHEPELSVSATCVRVPVMIGHSEAAHIEFKEPADTDYVRDILSRAPGIKLLDDPSANVYPMPIEAAGNDEVLVGRIRQDESHHKGVAMWIAGDNLRKGAALNAIQIAEEIVSMDLFSDR